MKYFSIFLDASSSSAYDSYSSSLLTYSNSFVRFYCYVFYATPLCYIMDCYLSFTKLLHWEITDELLHELVLSSPLVCKDRFYNSCSFLALTDSFCYRLSARRDTSVCLGFYSFDWEWLDYGDRVVCFFWDDMYLSMRRSRDFCICSYLRGLALLGT